MAQNDIYSWLKSLNITSLAILVLLMVATTQLGKVYNFVRVWYYARRIPSPRGLPIIGHLLEFMVPVEELMTRLSSFCDPNEALVNISLLHRRFVLLYRPETVEVILSSPKYTYKGDEYSYMKPWLGEGLVTSEGPKWAARRRLLTPAFHFKILEDFLSVFNDHSVILTNKLCTKFKDTPVDVLPQVVYCTLDIICETAMGKKINCQAEGVSEYSTALLQISDIIMARSFNPLMKSDYLFKLTENGKKHEKYLKILHDFTEEVIREKKAILKQRNTTETAEEKKKDDDDVYTTTKKRRAFLDLLLEVSEDGKVLSDSDIREEVDTFMFAGHDTTSTSTSWCLYALGGNPDCQKRVHEELDEVFGDSDRPVTMEDLTKLKYMERCIKESMRLYAPVPFISRELKEDVVIQGYKLPAGMLTSILPYVLHHNPQVFPNPKVYDPDNFLPERVAGRHPYAFIPFSAGPRNCVGQKFAGMEQKVLMANILRRLKVESIHKPEELHHISSIVLRAKEGLVLKFSPRK